MHNIPKSRFEYGKRCYIQTGLGAVDVTQNIRICSPCDETEKAVYIDAQELKAP